MAAPGFAADPDLPRFLAIPAAEFQMGSDDHLPNERPRHRVAVSAVEIGETAVTRGQYAAFIAATGRVPPPFWDKRRFSHPRQPVCGVSWKDARAYCDWLGGVIGARVHLPSEAQREWAASGGDDRRLYPWGDTPRLAGALSAPPPVALGPPNAFGLHDMGEGVHEWCADWYAADAYSDPDPLGPSEGVRRSARGGSWRHRLPFSRVTARSALDPGKHFSDFGFRVARSERFEYRP